MLQQRPDAVVQAMASALFGSQEMRRALAEETPEVESGDLLRHEPDRIARETTPGRPLEIDETHRAVGVHDHVARRQGMPSDSALEHLLDQLPQADEGRLLHGN